jgi:ADP-heptose:LPS heptosyltransferase
VRLDRAALWRGARVHPVESASASNLLGALSHPVLAMHRGAGGVVKRWSPAAFAAVAGRWRACGGGVVELLGPAEVGDAAADGAAVARDWPLPDLAALLARVDAYVGNDSGPSHLAAAVGAPTVVVFTATSSRRWRPLGPQVRVLRSAGNADASHPSVARVLAAVAAMESLTSTRPGSSVRPSTESARLREPASAASPAASEDVRPVSRAAADERSRAPGSPPDDGR